MNKALFHIADETSAKFRPAMTNTFNIIIPGLNGLVDITSSEEGALIGEDAEIVLKVSNEDFQEPVFRQNTVQLKRSNLTIEFPGDIQAFSSTSNFSCFVDADTYGPYNRLCCRRRGSPFLKSRFCRVLSRRR